MEVTSAIRGRFLPLFLVSRRRVAQCRPSNHIRTNKFEPTKSLVHKCRSYDVEQPDVKCAEHVGHHAMQYEIIVSYSQDFSNSTINVIPPRLFIRSLWFCQDTGAGIMARGPGGR